MRRQRQCFFILIFLLDIGADIFYKEGSKSREPFEKKKVLNK